MKNFYTIIIGLVVILVSVLLGFLVFRGFLENNQQQLASTNSERSKTKEFVCIPQKAIKSDGSVYTNELLGFSVRPSKDWTISVECKENNFSEVTIEAPDSGEEVSPGQIPPHYYRRKFEIDVEKRNKTLPINELKEEIKNSTVYNPYDDAKITKITIANNEALKVIDSAAAGVIDIHFSHNSKVYIISHLEFVEGSSVDNPKYTKEFDQLVSSFKLIE